MKRRAGRAIACFLACVATLGMALALTQVAVAEPGVARERTLVLGRLSDDPKRHYEALQPLLEYVVARMGDVGIVEGRILMARDAAQMVGFLRHRRVDWVTDTAAVAAEFRKRAGAEIVLAADRDGEVSYHSVVFARRDSGIGTLADLKGRSIAFQNPVSTSSFMLPAARMLRSGLDLEKLISPYDRPDARHVGYSFADTGNNIAMWVHKRIIDAGALSNLEWEALEHMPGGFRNDLAIIDQTASAPRGLELVAAGLDPRIKARLLQVLIGAANDPQAQDALHSYFGVTRFVPLNETLQRELDRIQADVELVRRELE